MAKTPAIVPAPRLHTLLVGECGHLFVTHSTERDEANAFKYWDDALGAVIATSPDRSELVRLARHISKLTGSYTNVD